MSGAALAQATVDVSGVKYDDAVDLRGTKLTLNGAGVRYKAVFKVYTAGLYLGKKAGTPEEALAMPGAKRMHIVMLRDIDSAELGKLFSRGIEDNMDKAAFSKLIPGVMRMSQLFSDRKKLSAGESFLIDWIPGTGTIVTVKQPQVRDGRRVQGARVLQRAAAHLAGPHPRRLQAQGRAAGQGRFLKQLVHVRQQIQETVGIHGAHRLAVVVAIGHQQHRAAG